MRRVVITGLGSVSPCGIGVPAAWDAMIHARSGTSAIESFDTDGYRVRIAGEVKGFDGEALLGRRAVRRLGRFMQFALVAGDEAMDDAGFDLQHVDGGSGTGAWPEPNRFGVYIGSGIGGLPEIVECAVDLYKNGPRSISPFFIPRSLINIATGAVAIRYSARGPSLVVATACAVGNHAIGEAYRAVCFGDADVILAGGTEASISPLGVTGFMNMKALSKRNDDPETASRPFDVDRDGFVMSEGAGVVVLEALDHAEARGARIYAEVIGYGGHDRCPSCDRAFSRWSRGRSLHASRAGLGGRAGGAGGLHQRARDLDSRQRRRGDSGDPIGLRQPCRPPDGVFDKGRHRSLARRCRWAGSHRHGQGLAHGDRPAYGPLAESRSGMRSRLRAARGP